jgi:hypothetical protein
MTMDRVTISAEQRLLPKDQQRIIKLFKEIYKESLSNYHFYGTLRATIAWPPATLVCASGVYLLSNLNIHLLRYGEYLPPIIFIAVLGLTVGQPALAG